MSDTGFWRVRVCLPGSIIHLASKTIPQAHLADGRVLDVAMSLIEGVGDTVGFIDWPAVVAVTWRFDAKGKLEE